MTDDLRPAASDDAQYHGDAVWTPPVGDTAMPASTPEASFAPAATPGVWTQIRQWLFPSALERAADAAERLMQWSDAVALYPDAPTAWVMRGEIYLETRQFDLAAEDFHYALNLCRVEFENTAWGFTAQVMQDRALAGLEQVAAARAKTGAG